MKENLWDILRNPNDVLIAIDMDGTLCHGEFWGRPDDPEPTPNVAMVELTRDLHQRGAHIVLYSARQPFMYAATHAWLIKHGVPFHGICMTMKPGADLYIDDKTLNTEDLFNDSREVAIKIHRVKPQNHGFKLIPVKSAESFVMTAPPDLVTPHSITQTA